MLNGKPKDSSTVKFSSPLNLKHDGTDDSTGDSPTTSSSCVIVRSRVKHPTARAIMMEMDAKISPVLGKPYKVMLED